MSDEKVVTPEEMEQERKKYFKKTVLSLINDFSENLDKCLATYDMERTMYNLGYSAYFINRGLNDEELVKKWKEVFEKALGIAKKIEIHNAEELAKQQEETNKKLENKEVK